VVVDEAQDLSPMQLRMIGRRSLSGSLTLVGDLAQATGPAAVDEWDNVLKHLTPSNNQKLVPQYVELSVSYRTPSEILDVAAAVLAEAAPTLTCPTAVRQSDIYPIVAKVDSAALAAQAVSNAAAFRQEIGLGTVAVISAPSLCDLIEKAFGDAGLQAQNAYQSLESDYVVVSSDVMKGLEFDAIVVVEPASIVAESNQGLKSLYVALTRATRRLAVVYFDDLPASLARGLNLHV
jgi:DNA helicase IV